MAPEPRLLLFFRGNRRAWRRGYVPFFLGGLPILHLVHAGCRFLRNDFGHRGHGRRGARQKFPAHCSSFPGGRVSHAPPGQQRQRRTGRSLQLPPDARSRLLVIELRRNWRALTPVSFVFSIIYFWGWYEKFYQPAKLGRTLIFATLF